MQQGRQIDSQIGDRADTSRFYRQLLALTSDVALEPLIDEVLLLLVELAGAGMAYVEVIDEGGMAVLRGHSCAGDDLPTIRGALSADVVLRAMEKKQTVCQQAILCVPIASAGLVGFIYLSGSGDFSPIDCFHVELLARQLMQRHAQHAVSAAPRSFHQATKFYQRRHVLEVLEQMDWKMTAAARKLGVARSHLYRLVELLQLKRSELPEAQVPPREIRAAG